ncbi:hypothetical protein GCM10027570_33310 [Streptomonospora sediminis]
MSSTMLADVRGADAEYALRFARIVAESGLEFTARVDPFSEPDFEPFDEDDDDQPADDDPAIEWP